MNNYWWKQLGIHFADGPAGGDGGAGGGEAPPATLEPPAPVKTEEGNDSLPPESHSAPSKEEIELLGGQPKPTEGEPAKKEGATSLPAGGSPPPVAPTAPVTTIPQQAPLSSADIKTILEEMPGKIAEGLKPKPEPVKPQPRTFFKFEVKPEDMDKLIADPVKGAEFLNVKINEGLQKVREEMAEVMGQWVMGQMQEFEEKKFKPVVETHEQYQAQQREANRQGHLAAFKTRHADLSDATDIAEAVAKEILTSPNPPPYKTYEEFYDDVANRTRPIVAEYRKRWGGNGTGAAPAKVAAPPMAAAPKARSVAAAGEGGRKTQDQLDYEAMLKG